MAALSIQSLDDLGDDTRTDGFAAFADGEAHLLFQRDGRDELDLDGHVVKFAYDDHYTGLAATLAEGERLAAVMGTKPIVFMKNHGVLVTGDSVAQAYRRLYRIERICRNQILALGTGRPIAVLGDDVVARVQKPSADDRHSREERERLFFDAMMRVLDRDLPGYRE